MGAVAKIKTLSLLDIEPQLLGSPAHSPLYKKKYTALCLFANYDTLTDRKSAVGRGKCTNVVYGPFNGIRSSSSKAFNYRIIANNVVQSSGSLISDKLRGFLLKGLRRTTNKPQSRQLVSGKRFQPSTTRQ